MKALLLGLAVGLAACSDKDVATDDTNPAGDDTDLPATDAVCTEPTPISCTDAIISELSLHDDAVSDGEVTTTEDNGDFVTLVDASAGGYSNASKNPWVYIKFTATGAEKVEIDDETALESMDWDMSLRRYILRLNGGDSGPSCVGAAAFLEKSYDELSSVPEGLSYGLDDYYTDDCTLVEDTSGLPGSPAVVLGPWWTYPGCVATTGVPFLIQLADGHILKLRVETYYKTDQDICDTTGTVPSDGGYITLRWRMMQ